MQYFSVYWLCDGYLQVIILQLYLYGYDCMGFMFIIGVIDWVVYCCGLFQLCECGLLCLQYDGLCGYGNLCFDDDFWIIDEIVYYYLEVCVIGDGQYGGDQCYQ